MSAGPPAPTPAWRAGVQVATVTSDLEQPVAVAAAPDGDAVVVDGHRIVRVRPDGNATLVAGSGAGFADGDVSSAMFNSPRGVAVGADGTIYVADTYNNRVRAVARGRVWTVAGSQRGFADGVGGAARLTWPMSVAVSGTGTLLVTDTWNHRIREVWQDGTVTTWAGNGTKGLSNGPGASAQLLYPMYLTVLPGGDALFVEPESGMLRKVSAAAPHIVSPAAGHLATTGWNDGAVGDALVSETIAVGARANGEIVFIDGASARIRALHEGSVDTLAGGRGSPGADGAGSSAGFGFPRGIAAAPEGHVFVVDVETHSLRRITVP
jgi:glucose/arabinose dehydrogenase